jgi:PAS domain S-box-containing protein
MVKAWNSGAQGLYGLSGNEVLGLRLGSLALPPDLLQVVRQVASTLQSGEPQILEIAQAKGEGPLQLFQVTISTLRNEVDTVTGAVAIARDLADKNSLGESDDDRSDDDRTGADRNSLQSLQQTKERHILPEDHAVFDAAFERALQTGELSFEVRVRWSDDSIHWMSARGQFLFDESGQSVRGDDINDDSTQREQGNTPSLDREQHLAAIFTQAAVGLSEITLDGRFISANDELCRLIGRTPQEMMMLSVADVTHPDDLEQTRTALQQVISEHRPVSVDKRYLRPDGSEVWANSTITLLQRENGIQRVLVVTVDLTQRHEAEAAMRESEERFRLLVEGAKDYAMFLMDPQGRIIHWNGGAERIFGWTREEAVGQSAEIIFVPADRAQGIPILEMQTAVRNGRAPDKRWHQRQDGSLFWADGIMAALRTEAGELRGFAKIARDATKERTAEEELQRAHAELEARVEERTQKLQEEMAKSHALQMQRTQLIERIVRVQEEERGRVSRELHDNLGQHLTAILLQIQALENKEKDGASTQRRTSDAALSRLYKIVNDLMGVAHSLAWELRPATLDNVGLEAALEQYVTDWSKQAGASRSVTADFVSRVDESDGGVSGDAETALFRVTQEALSNVLRHSGATHVSVIVESRDQWLTVIVEDNGRGFDQKSASKKGRLGVLGMRERMELVGGTLEIESTRDAGTTVYARVPRVSTQMQRAVLS